MMYQGSEAVRLDYLGEATPRREQRTSFEVVEGAGLDHLERRGVSPQFIANLKLADTASEGTGTADEATDAQATDAAPDATQAQKSSDEVASEVGQATQTQGDGSTAGANAADVDSLS